MWYSLKYLGKITHNDLRVSKSEVFFKHGTRFGIKYKKKESIAYVR